MLHSKFQGHRPLVPQKIFKGFYHIWAWRTHWSCEMDHLNKLSFPHPMEDTNEIWLQSAMRFLKKKNEMLNLTDLGPRSMNDLDL